MTITVRHIVVAATLTLSSAVTPAQPMTVTRIDPPNWWTGMASSQVQLMVYGSNLTGINARSESPGLRVKRVYRTPDPSYAFIDIDITPAAFEGFHRLNLFNSSGSVPVNYPVLRRKRPAHRGFDSGDVVYLITPDRFANGDTTNDSVEGMPDRKDRPSPLGRHGGDIRGMINRLDYLADLGVTALWSNPLIENNMPWASYHGYAATDLYRIDPRFGTNELYQEFVRQAHRRGLKVIMDHVSNHIGIAHPWMDDLPSADWLNGSVADHQRVINSKIELTDIHSDSSVRASTVLGWFSDTMPDLNQRNSFVARYLIQNTLWWIESTGIDGIREDTFPYADPRYLADWARAIFTEYPDFNVVGEVWIGEAAYLAPYQNGSPLGRSVRASLPSVTDFALYDAMTQVFGNKGSIHLLYDCLAKDHLYGDPYALLTFVDNHDVRRILQVTQGDTKRALLALKILLTTRGIPQILYGTEIGMVGGKEHGVIRGDFPGGFPGDSTDAFTPEGRSTAQNAYFGVVRQLIHLHRERRSVAFGRLMHYPPANEVYAYIRILDNEKTLIIVNNREESQRAGLAQFRDQLGGAKSLRNLLTGAVIDLSTALEVPIEGNDAAIFAVM